MQGRRRHSVSGTGQAARNSNTPRQMAIRHATNNRRYSVVAAPALRARATRRCTGQPGERSTWGRQAGRSCHRSRRGTAPHALTGVGIREGIRPAFAAVAATLRAVTRARGDVKASGRQRGIAGMATTPPTVIEKNDHPSHPPNQPNHRCYRTV